MLVCTWVTGVNGRLDGTRVLINGDMQNIEWD